MYDYGWEDAVYSNGGKLFNKSGTECNLTMDSVENAICLQKKYISFPDIKIPHPMILIQGRLHSANEIFRIPGI